MGRLKKGEALPIVDQNDRLALIHIVHQHPTLWDDTSPLYKCKSARQRAWETVKEFFDKEARNYDVSCLTRSWKSLRDTYKKKLKDMRELEVMKNCEATHTHLQKIISWRFFSAMYFMAPPFQDNLDVIEFVNMKERQCIAEVQKIKKEIQKDKIDEEEIDEEMDSSDEQHTAEVQKMKNEILKEEIDDEMDGSASQCTTEVQKIKNEILGEEIDEEMDGNESQCTTEVQKIKNEMKEEKKDEVLGSEGFLVVELEQSDNELAESFQNVDGPPSSLDKLIRSIAKFDNGQASSGVIRSQEVPGTSDAQISVQSYEPVVKMKVEETVQQPTGNIQATNHLNTNRTIPPAAKKRRTMMETDDTEMSDTKMAPLWALIESMKPQPSPNRRSEASSNSNAILGSTITAKLDEIEAISRKDYFSFRLQLNEVLLKMETFICNQDS